MDSEIKGEGNSVNYKYRMHDPRVGRWLSYDPKSTAWESPYVSMGNNPVFYTDVHGDSIPTKFYDASGNETSSIPEEVQKMFNEEYGVKVAYENGKLYSTGNSMGPNQKQSESAKKEVDKYLGDTNWEGELVFGYGLEVEMLYKGEMSTAAVQFGLHVGGPLNKTFIDLADFSPGSQLPLGLSIEGDDIDTRTLNMARVFEHEFLGHAVNMLLDDVTFKNPRGGTVDLVNQYRSQMGLVERLDYSPSSVAGKIYITFGNASTESIKSAFEIDDKKTKEVSKSLLYLR